MFQGVKRIDYKDLRINARASWQICRVGNILPQFFKILDRIVYTILMLTYKSYYHIARLIYVNWLTKKKVMWILGWELIIISLLCRQLVRIVRTFFLNVHLCLWLHANGANWVNISEHQLLIVRVKQCYSCCDHC